MRKTIIVNDIIKKEFNETLDRILENNKKETFDMQWKIYDLENRLEIAENKVKKLTTEKKKLEKLIEEYDKEVNNEINKKRKK